MRGRRLAALAAATLLLPFGPARAEPLPNPVIPRIVVKPTVAKTAEFAQIEITWENMGGSGISRIEFGDGSPPLVSYAFDFGCGAVMPLTSYTEVIPHAYRYAGSWTVTVTFEPTECPAGDHLPPYEGEGTVTVTQGRKLSNGPVRPHFWTGGIGASEPSRSKHDGTMVFGVTYEDYDGYLTRLVYRWGDGTPDRVFTFPLSRCKDPKDHWPWSASSDEYPWGGVTHRYSRKGTYTATAIVVTTGCDGRDKQTASSSTRVVVK